jgi:hypothetical protein
MAGQSQLLKAILDVQTSLQAIRIADGFNFDVKAASVVTDPVAIDTVPLTELPYFVIGGGDEAFSLDRDYTPSRYSKDIVRLPVWARGDAAGTSFVRKMTIWTQLLADIERALTGARGSVSKDTNITRGGVAIDTRLLTSEAPFIGLGTQSIVLVKQLVEIRLNPRPFGEPI